MKKIGRKFFHKRKRGDHSIQSSEEEEELEVLIENENEKVSKNDFTHRALPQEEEEEEEEDFTTFDRLDIQEQIKIIDRDIDLIKEKLGEPVEERVSSKLRHKPVDDNFSLPKGGLHYNMIVEQVKCVGDVPRPNYGMTCHRYVKDNREYVLFMGLQGIYLYDTETKKFSKYNKGVANFLHTNIVDRKHRRPQVWGHTSQLYQNRYLYVYGGIDRYGENGDIVDEDLLFVYDLEEEKWTRLKTTGTIPELRRSCCSFIKGNRFYIFGGVGHILVTCRSFDLYELNLDTLYWRLIEPLQKPSKRYGHCCIPLQNDNEILCGFGQYFRSYRDIYIYYRDQELWLEKEVFGHPPRSCAYKSVVQHENKLLFFGGRDVRAERYHQFHILDTFNWRWKEIRMRFGYEIREIPSLSGHCAVMIGSQEKGKKMLIFGGNSNEGRSNRMYEVHMPFIMEIKRENFVDCIIIINEEI